MRPVSLPILRGRTREKWIHPAALGIHIHEQGFDHQAGWDCQQRADTEKNLNTRRIDFELKQRQFAEQAQARNDELQRQVLERINQAIIDVAKERSLDLVIRDPAYAAAALDITTDVMKKLAAMEAAPAPAEPKKKKK